MAFTAHEAFTLLSKANTNGRLAHAYLITGPEGSGTRELALRLAGELLACAEGEVARHPDSHIVSPESRSRMITVEQLRDVESQLYKRPVKGGNKVAIIMDADRMNASASNAFLKTLEEPPQRTHLLLVSTQPDRLLDTILSRCIEVPLRPTTRRAPGPRQTRLMERLCEFSKKTTPDMQQAFVLAREFQSLLAEAKAEINETNEAAFKDEVKRYKQTTDVSGSWVDSREDFYKALTEARYRQERAALVATLEEWWGDVLRQQHAAEHLDHPEFSAETAVVAGRVSTPEALRRAGAITALRDNFERNVQEALAIEVAFLEAFAA
jgi:DNA polymerase III subunit delta'